MQVILAFLFTLSTANATDMSYIINQSNDSLVSISNMTKLYNYDAFIELNLLVLEYKNALETGNFVEYNKHASRWNLMMRTTGNKTIIDMWTMPIRPEPEKEELDNSGIYINREYTTHMPLPNLPSSTPEIVSSNPPLIPDRFVPIPSTL